MSAQDEDDYYNSRSKQESVATCAWCFISIAILVALAAIHALFNQGAT